MKMTRLYALALVLTLLMTLSGAVGAQEPELLAAGGCAAGVSYDPDCDVDHNGATNIVDLQLVAGHWGQQGVFISDNTHDHLGQAWAGNDNPLTISGTFKTAPLVLSNSDPTGDGLIIAPVGGDGVVVTSADFDGVNIGAAAGGDGVFVGSAAFDGVHISAAGDFAGFFSGFVKITNGSCLGCVLSAVGRNAGQTALEPGDVVAVRGVTRLDLVSDPVVMEVALAAGPGAVIGVVAGRAELSKYEEAGKTIQRLVPRAGPAQPGEYVNIITHGLAQVKASAADGPIEEGARLTGSDEPGRVRAVRTVEVQGVQIAESSSVIGVALDKLDAGQDGLIWALVNPR